MYLNEGKIIDDFEQFLNFSCIFTKILNQNNETKKTAMWQLSRRFIDAWCGPGYSASTWHMLTISVLTDCAGKASVLSNSSSLLAFQWRGAEAFLNTFTKHSKQQCVLCFGFPVRSSIQSRLLNTCHVQGWRKVPGIQLWLESFSVWLRGVPNLERRFVKTNKPMAVAIVIQSLSEIEQSHAGENDQEWGHCLVINKNPDLWVFRDRG